MADLWDSSESGAACGQLPDVEQERNLRQQEDTEPASAAPADYGKVISMVDVGTVSDQAGFDNDHMRHWTELSGAARVRLVTAAATALDHEGS